jgi:hypothetical protein
MWLLKGTFEGTAGGVVSFIKLLLMIFLKNLNEIYGG